MTDSKTGLGKSLGWVCGISMCPKWNIFNNTHPLTVIRQVNGAANWKSLWDQAKKHCSTVYKTIPTSRYWRRQLTKELGVGETQITFEKELSVTDELSTRGGKTASHSLQTECILWHPDMVSWTATNTDSRRAEMTCHGKPGKRFLWSKSVGTNSERPWNTPFQPCHKATFSLLKSPCPHH